MQRLKISLFAAVLAAAALAGAGMAQNAAEKPGVDVRRVASRLACQCGCNDTVATCAMLDCSFSGPAKIKIAKMQAAGMSDQAIIDSFVAEYGPGIYRAQPNAFGWIIPYLSVLLGMVVVWRLLKHYLRPRPVAATGVLDADDPALAKYQQQIEKDLANLD